ncbi:TPA: glycosyltransferase family 4 protein [Methanosarcinaceae archaeon]|nr:glycosyltransferase family 4 protein [Methanosarcinaceae archaeon]
MLSYCISANRFLQKILLKNIYDINHTHFIIPTGIVSYLNRKNIPYVITSHGSDVPGHNPDKFSFEHKLVKPLWNRIINSSRKIITPSEYLKDLIIKNANTDNIEVISNGFNSFELSPKKKEKKILLVGRLVEFKGFQYFLEAIKDIKIDYEVNIVGDGPYKEALMEKARGIEAKINFVGWLDNKSSKYKYLFERSSILVHPSSAESFGMVLLEAMSSGCAIITTNSSACAEVVGDAALLVKPENPAEIRDALLKLINDEKLLNRMSAEARERVKQNFSWEGIARQYVSIYTDVIK